MVKLDTRLAEQRDCPSNPLAFSLLIAAIIAIANSAPTHAVALALMLDRKPSGSKGAAHQVGLLLPSRLGSHKDGLQSLQAGRRRYSGDCKNEHVYM